MKKAIVTVAVFLVFALAMFGVGSLVDPSSGIHSLEPDSPCPVTQCASGECHGFEQVPGPDGIHEMTCPEASCSSVECHAWDSLIDRYHQASDASLNVWILMPVVLVVVILLLIKFLSRGNEAKQDAKDVQTTSSDLSEKENGEGENHA